jgi:indole-3-glycerol phosphate synthase
MSFLEAVIVKKQEKLKTAIEQTPMYHLEEKISSMPPCKDFLGYILEGKPGIIAEYKRSSPSRGIINHDVGPVEQALAYKAGGAHAISVLTEEDYFHGSPDDLQQIAASCPLPILRKDFIFDRYHLYEARAWGASAVLLIVRVLGRHRLAELMKEARALGLQTLVEVGNEEELAVALDLGVPIIGINNRDLDTLAVDTETTFRLLKQVPKGQVIVGESGLTTDGEVRSLYNQGISAVLIGESLMRSHDPAAMILQLKGGKSCSR